MATDGRSRLLLWATEHPASTRTGSRPARRTTPLADAGAGTFTANSARLDNMLFADPKRVCAK
ncbi:hypothetical protein SCOCK_190045 [Actinacidiphila cocklensis]|uniref:Uncharacterized protein n=1 Tax=Actinacidiphila cocklensis TaxID=887465 RepID=A0A9W4GQ31_9ACTN|nr:hypothetical protein SCOCK_190045 [Actinacidiphila cocklensis]